MTSKSRCAGDTLKLLSSPHPSLLVSSLRIILTKKNERKNNIWKHEMKQKWIASILKILIPTEVLSIHQGPRRSLWDKMKLRPHKQEKNQGWLKNLVLFTHYDNMMHTLPSLTSSLSSLFDLPTQFGDKYYDKKNSSWLVWYSGCIADPVFSVKPLKLWTMTQQVKRLKNVARMARLRPPVLRLDSPRCVALQLEEPGERANIVTWP